MIRQASMVHSLVIIGEFTIFVSLTPQLVDLLLSFAPGVGFNLELVARFNIHASSWVKSQNWWNQLDAGCDLSTAASVRTKGLIEMSASNGKPKLRVSQILTNVETGNIDSHGSPIGHVLNMIAPTIRAELANKLDKIIEHFLEDTTSKLEDIDWVVPIETSLPLNRSSLAMDVMSFVIYGDHLAVDVQLHVTDPAQSRVVSQTVKHSLPVIYDSSKMLTLSSAPEVLEDYLVFHQSTPFHTVRSHDLPPDSTYGLNTWDLKLMTFPGLYRVFGYDLVADQKMGYNPENGSEFRTYSRSWVGTQNMSVSVFFGNSTNVFFDNDTVKADLDIFLEFWVEHSHSSEHAFTLHAPTHADVTNLKVLSDPQRFVGELSSVQVKKVRKYKKHKKVKMLNLALIIPLVRILNARVITPMLKDFFMAGLPCDFGDFSLNPMTTEIASGALSVYADLVYDLAKLVQ